MRQYSNGTPVFGPGGNSKSFYDEGHKHTTEAPAWVAARGLGAYEYQAGNGLNGGIDTFRKIGESAEEEGIRMSLHSPYFISLSGVNPEQREKSTVYIRDCVNVANALGADMVVIHTGSAAKISREVAMEYAADTLRKTLEVLEEEFGADIGGVRLGLETMGKQNQLGTLDEVIELCRTDERLYPVVDFGHLNARVLGGAFDTADDYRRVFSTVGDALGENKLMGLHCHFSKIEFTTGGEKRHLTFEDNTYGPSFEPFAEAIVRDGLCPRVICESSGTMAEDAATMKTMCAQVAR